MKQFITVLLVFILGIVSISPTPLFAQEADLYLPVVQVGSQEEADGQTGSVPLQYRYTYSSLNSLLNDTLLALQPVPLSDTPVTFGAELMTASAHRGEDLLGPYVLNGNLRVVDELRALGIEGVTIQTTFPFFVPSHPRHHEYVDFYKRLLVELRKRNLTVVMKAGPVITGFASPSAQVDYQQMTEADYWRQRKQAIQVIAEELAPDYLTLGNEPSTESLVTGFDITPEDYQTFIDETLALLPDNGTLYGVGVGSWDNRTFVENFVTTEVDYLDLHIYPISSGFNDYFQTAADFARLAKNHGKRVIIGEFWLYKLTPAQVVSGKGYYSAFSLDPYSFWQPLDQKMLEAVAMLAKVEGIEFVTPFWTKYFFRYLPYSEAIEAQGPTYRIIASDRLLAERLISGDGSFSATGWFYKDLITRY